MADDGKRDTHSKESSEGEAGHERFDLGISERVKRAMAAGLEAAARSKDDLLRAATSEVGSWLDRLDIQSELAKVLSKMVVEVKAEIRFRPKEDGTLVPEATSDVSVKNPSKS
jgi:hypothetical protein